jgi:hypothetical protein
MQMRGIEGKGVHVVILRHHQRANQEAAVPLLLIWNRTLCLERSGAGTMKVRLQRNKTVDRFVNHGTLFLED